MADDEPQRLDYATPEPPRRKDVSEYYREPPNMAEWGSIEWLCVVCFVIALVVVGVWAIVDWVPD